MKQFKVGDLCLTCNTKASVLNDGLLVVIIAVDPPQFCPEPYWIRRVDGQAFPVAGPSKKSGGLAFFKSYEVNAPASKLRKIDPDALDLADHRTARESTAV